MSILVAGLDLGQSQDYSALTVVEAFPSMLEQEMAYIDEELHLPAARMVQVEGLPLAYHVRHLERYPLKMSYPSIVNDVRLKMASIPEALLSIDQTGCGRPVFDLFEAAGLEPVGVSITGGDTVHGEGRTWRVPKRDLVGVLQVAFQADRLKVANRLAEAKTLVEELLNFRVSISQSGHDSYEAWRSGTHDDLVLAVALACWTATLCYTRPREEIVTYYEPYQISPY